MTGAAEVLGTAVDHHMAGRLDEAEALYSHILQGVPGNGDALFYFGMLQAQRGRLAEAEDLLRQAADRLPDRADIHFNLGQVLVARGDWPAAEGPLRAAAGVHPGAAAMLGRRLADTGRAVEAETILASAAARQPGDADLWRDLGLIRLRLDRAADAADAFRHAAELRPADPSLWQRLGRALQTAGHPGEARTAYQRAKALGAGGPDLDRAIGVVASALGDAAAAETAFRAALAANPAHLDAIQDLAVLLRLSQRLDESIALLKDGLDRHPRAPGLLLNLGLALTDRARYGDAEAALQKGLALDPSDRRIWLALIVALHQGGRTSEAHQVAAAGLARFPEDVQLLNALALILRLKGDMAGAEAALRAALAQTPDSPDILSNLGLLLMSVGRPDEAVASFRRALALAPDNAAAHHNLIFTLDFVDGVSEAERQAARRTWFERIGRPVANRYGFDHVDRAPERRLRVGYVSADFRNHSASKVFGPVLENHDRAAVHVTCYSGVRVPDAVTEHLKGCADAWVEMAGLTDRELADRIHADGIDVLVDLSGHSSGNRLAVFAMRPAPVRITAWGHATGTGIEGMDALFADPVLIPADERAHFSERVVDLPCCMSIPVDGQLPPVVARRPDPAGIVFASLNRISKLTDGSVAAWSDILRRLPGSRLLLKDPALDQDAMREATRRRFAAHGINPARLDLRGRTERSAHLATLSEVDIALDPFPAGGGVTTAEALLMGVPVVCLIGNGPTSRVGASITAAAGLDDLATPDVPAYVLKALELAAAPECLRDLRAHLRDRIAAMPLGNARLYTRAVEGAYRRVWRDWCSRGG